MPLSWHSHKRFFIAACTAENGDTEKTIAQGDFIAACTAANKAIARDAGLRDFIAAYTAANLHRDDVSVQETS